MQPSKQAVWDNRDGCGRTSGRGRRLAARRVQQLERDDATTERRPSPTHGGRRTGPTYRSHRHDLRPDRVRPHRRARGDRRPRSAWRRRVRDQPARRQLRRRRSTASRRTSTMVNSEGGRLRARADARVQERDDQRRARTGTRSRRLLSAGQRVRGGAGRDAAVHRRPTTWPTPASRRSAGTSTPSGPSGAAEPLRREGLATSCFTCGSRGLARGWPRSSAARRSACWPTTCAQSADCADADARAFEQVIRRAEVVFFDDQPCVRRDRPVSGEVGEMKDAGVDFVITCMDSNGCVTLAREMKKQELDAVQYLPQRATTTSSSPSTATSSRARYVRTVLGRSRTEDPAPGHEELPEVDGDERRRRSTRTRWPAGSTPTSSSPGSRAPARDFTRQKVDRRDQRDGRLDADGLIPGIDWTVAHDQPAPDGCRRRQDRRRQVRTRLRRAGQAVRLLHPTIPNPTIAPGRRPDACSLAPTTDREASRHQAARAAIAPG